MRRSLSAALASACLLLAPATRAQGTGDGDAVIAAREAFTSGAQAFQRRDYRAAALAYETANRLAPSAIALYNAAASWEKVPDERAREADAYAGALDLGGLPEAERSQAAARLALLNEALGVVRVEAPAGARVTVGALVDAEPPARAHVPPGEVVVQVVLRDGTRHQRKLAVRAGQTATARVQAPTPSAPPPPRSTVLPVLGWTSVGLGVVGAGVGIALGVTAVGARDDYLASQSAEDWDRADTLQTATNVAWVAAGVFAATGATLIVVDLATEPGTDRVGSLAVGPTGASATWRF